MQDSLFDAAAPEVLTPADAEVSLYRTWLDAATADVLYEQLRRELAWEQSVIRIHGRQVPIPRLNAWYGDPGSDYGYSGIALAPQSWTASLLEVRARLEDTLGQRFNSVLANLYRDGRDSVAWHSDDEAELGRNPLIASVSLGGERRFVLKHKKRKDVPKLEVWLPHGSLLVMSGTTQHAWVHQLPKTAKPVGPRINLTFRQIVKSQSAPQRNAK
ncbi:alpha-ketoglutarate-dependent dioxygenase AlkB [Exilibacterium tricleocarpae]|uniref:Alpha-ketoglutarate-dependent dioxygenase AlkB n=1 Tax=Exilibacterium tricleocarpae TaxID=2591008 RepID=A0A545TVR8_9GAMM|nr:alpha-ketoglutarate-dependent dioxygenase AlkB [Exilibacterium tricleocarpae]TQV81319.1 alpha-ketoglutarate-dependent dioxygenase AlkB [Exilibacterium tricleocarpae]